jgi:hypothetical protein
MKECSLVFKSTTETRRHGEKQGSRGLALNQILRSYLR